MTLQEILESVKSGSVSVEEAERILKLEIIALDSALKNEESMLPSETLVLGD